MDWEKIIKQTYSSDASRESLALLLVESMSNVESPIDFLKLLYVFLQPRSPLDPGMVIKMLERIKQYHTVEIHYNRSGLVISCFGGSPTRL